MLSTRLFSSTSIFMSSLLRPGTSRVMRWPSGVSFQSTLAGEDQMASLSRVEIGICSRILNGSRRLSPPHLRRQEGWGAVPVHPREQSPLGWHGHAKQECDC
uniref:Uncharacterized protein n=1 Tax=Opuntia streptacantha TaxID=393608 RepID=A0A7C9EZA9_OPUST